MATKEYLTNDSPRIKRVTLWENTGQVSEKKTGCPLGCVYCNQINLDTADDGTKLAGTIYPGIDSGISINWRLMTGAKVVREADPVAVINELRTYPYYTPEMPVVISNYSDPGLDWAESIGVGQNLVTELGHTGPIIFITKMTVSEANVDLMQNLQRSGGKPIVVVTYSGLPKEIEPSLGTRRVETMEKFHDAGVPVIMSMRPMVMGINTDEEKIRETIRAGAPHADIITVGGLYVYPDTAESFAGAGYPLPDIYLNHKYPVVKVLPDEVRETVRRVVGEICPTTQVHDHTTCAVSDIMTRRYGVASFDTLSHWTNSLGLAFDKCESFCPADQMVNCRTVFESPMVAIEKAKAVLTRMGYPGHEVVLSNRQEGLLLVQNGYLTISELFTIMRETGFKADNLPNLESITYRVREAFDAELKGQADKLVGCVQAGQEWYIVTDGKIDGTENNFLALKWARSYARCRIPETVDINSIGSAEMARNRARKICERSGCLEKTGEVAENLVALYEKHRQEHARK